MVVFSCIFWSDSMIAVILAIVHRMDHISGSRGLLMLLSCASVFKRPCSIRSTPHVVSIIVRDSFADCEFLRLIWERVLSSIPHISGEVISLPSSILPLSISLVSRAIVGTICATIFRLVSLRSRAGSAILGAISREMERVLFWTRSLGGILAVSSILTSHLSFWNDIVRSRGSHVTDLLYPSLMSDAHRSLIVSRADPRTSDDVSFSNSAIRGRWSVSERLFIEFWNSIASPGVSLLAISFAWVM